MELCVRSVAVLVARDAAAGDRRHFPRSRIQHFDLVIIGVCDDDPAIVDGHTKRMLQPGRVACAISVAELEEIASSQRADNIYRWEDDGSDGVRLGIRDV